MSRQRSGRADSHAALRRNGEVTCEPIGILSEEILHDAHAIAGAFVAKPKQHHTRMRLAAAKDEFAEVLVIGNEDSSLVVARARISWSSACGIASATASTSWPTPRRCSTTAVPTDSSTMNSMGIGA